MRGYWISEKGIIKAQQAIECEAKLELKRKRFGPVNRRVLGRSN